VIKALFCIIALLSVGFKQRCELALENLALSQQLALFNRNHKRLWLRRMDRLFWVYVSRIWERWRESLLVVKPDTVVRRHRKGFALCWRRLSRHNRAGRICFSYPLARDGLTDATVRMRGTATTFYSENPGKPLGHHWDADPAHPRNFDLELGSAKLTQRMSEGGYEAHPKIPTIYKTRHVMEQHPSLKEFSDKWAGPDYLGREVNFVGLTDPKYVSTTPSDFVLKGR
jgi:hypothetical protein